MCAAAHASLCVYTDAPPTDYSGLYNVLLSTWVWKGATWWLAGCASHMRRNPAHCPQAHKFKIVFFLSFSNWHVFTIRFNKTKKIRIRKNFKWMIVPIFLWHFWSFCLHRITVSLKLRCNNRVWPAGSVNICVHFVWCEKKKNPAILGLR